MIQRICFIFLITTLLFTCRKDEIKIDDPIIEIDEPIILEGYTPEVENVTASVYGQILNTEEEPLDEVTLIIDGEMATTDESGFFSLSNIQMNK